MGSRQEEKEQKSRIFVGNLAPDTNADDIRKRFETYGPIVNINRNIKGFAFVQYENEPDAKEAIAKENGRLLSGKKIDVKPAMRNIAGGSSLKGDTVAAGGGERGFNEVRDRDGFGDRYGGGNDRDMRAGSWGGGGSERDYRSGGGGSGYPPPLMGLGRGSYFGNGGGGGYRGGYDDDGPPPSSGGGRGGALMGGGSGGPQVLRGGPVPPAAAAEKPNDVEIICLNKHTRVYAEAVEARLKNMGLTVDVLFPNPDIPLGKVLGNIAGRGVMYAVCVAPDNELHRSLTVNVLQGEQQEHRNMPLDEAMSFIGKSFSRFIEKPTAGAVGGAQLGFARAGPAATSSGSEQLPPFGHPNDIRTILGFLIDDRPMSIMEYDKLIKYLATRRESTLKAEYGMNIPAHLLLPPVGPMQDPILKAKQEEIQNKVMEILSRPKKTQTSLAGAGAPALAAAAATPAPLAAGGGATGLNPALQQAIDSLVKTGPNLLSSLGKTAATSSVGGGADGSTSGGDSGNLGDYFSSLFGRGGGGAGGSALAGAAYK